MTHLIFVCMIGYAIGIVYASFAEWALHRYVMHRPVRIFGFSFTYPFHAHARVHHVVFGGGDSYILNTHPRESQDEDQETIPMKWWNGPVLILMASSPFVIWSIFRPSWWFTASIALAVASYYGAYEYLHFCMHKPKGRWLENTRLYKWIDKHHLIHHQHMGKNFNVVLPLADFCLGTLILE